MEWLNVINHNLVDAISLTLLHSLWQGMVILVVCSVMVWSGLVTSVTGKYYLHLFALVSIAIITMATFVVLSKFDGAAQGFHIFSPIEMQPLEVEIQQQTLNWQFLLTIIWLMGMGISLLRSFGTLVRTYLQCLRAYPVKEEWKEVTDRLRHGLGIKKSVRILQSGDVISPFVFGIWRPVIIFPSVYFLQLTPQQLESIILHELTHIRRHDFIINLLQVVIEGLLFFNPAVWYLSGKVRKYREFRCDDEVQSRIEDRSVYLKALYQLSVIKAQHPSLTLHLFRNQSEILIRMKRMVKMTPETSQVRSLLTVTLVCMAIAAGFAISSLFGEHTEGLQKSLDFSSVERTEKKIDAVERIQGNLSLIPKTDLLAPQNEVETKEAAKALKTTANRNPSAVFSSLAMVKDTIPPSPRMKELEQLLEVKAAELEQLSEQFEREMEQNLDLDVEEMEELAEKLSALQEDRVEEIEAKYGAQMERLEELAEQMHEEMEGLDEEMESLNEELIERLAEEMEMKAEKLGEFDSIPNDQGKQLQHQMQELHKQMQEEMRSVHDLHEQLRDNPELKQLREEMKALREQLQPMHEEYQSLWTEEARTLHEQLRQMQEELRDKMQGMNNQLHEQMRQKSEEMRELQKEMHKEMKNLHEKHLKQN